MAPEGYSPLSQTFIESVDRDLQKETNETTPERKQTLTKGEIQSLHNLKERDDIIITKADKGRAVVIINVDDYLKEAKRQLDKTEFYHKLDQDLAETHAHLVKETIRKFVKEKLLKEHVAKALTIDEPKTAKFYLLPYDPSQTQLARQHPPSPSSLIFNYNPLWRG